MYSYNHHFGDYAAETEHLSWDEDHAYTRLMRKYYHKEKPIPVDIEDACRLVRAETKQQKKAVELVLKEFFKLTPDGWRQKRCDEEIEKYYESTEENKLKNENEKERQKRYRARRREIFAMLREHNIIPKWDTSIHELETLLERHCNAPVTRDSPSPETSQEQNGHGYSLTDNQLPLTDNQLPKREKPRATRFTLNALPDEWAEFCKSKRPDLNPQEIFDRFGDYWRARAGAGGTKLDWLATWRNWVRDQKNYGGLNANQTNSFNGGVSKTRKREIENDAAIESWLASKAPSNVHADGDGESDEGVDGLPPIS